jgi:hypothetical protein
LDESVLDKILKGIPIYKPGTTYIIKSKSNNEKSTAAKDSVVNYLGGLRSNGLYLNAGKSLDVGPSLRQVLNTTVSDSGIVSALMSALGISQVVKNMAPSLLFLDELNSAS